MIELTCTKCRTVLSIDDAFAGGVCRCKHCGTIQTVPKQTKRSAIPASVIANGRPDNVNQAPGSGTGLDDLAHVVASSGLSGTGLAASRLRKAPPEGATAASAAVASGGRRESTLILAVGGTIVVLLGIIIAILVSSESGDATTGAKTVPPVAGTDTTQARPTGPHFLGMPIHASSVVFVLDRGSGMMDTFDPMRVALQNSLPTLPPSTRFQIVFWEADTPPIAIPDTGMVPATKENIAAAHKALGDAYYAFAQSKVEPALSKALAQNPTDIILATGKSGLDDAFAQSVLGILRARAVKIHTLALGSASTETLKTIAQKTGGEFREITHAELHRFAE